MKNRVWKKLSVGFLSVACAVCAAFGCILAQTANAEEAYDFSSVGGISVEATGKNGKKNASLYVNLPEVTSLAGVESIVFDVTLTAGDRFTPLLIDSNGNYYEYMGSTTASQTTYYMAKTLSVLQDSTHFVRANAYPWFNISPEDGRGAAGRTDYSFDLSDFYMRANLDNYGGTVEKAAKFASPLSATQQLKAVGFRVPEDYYNKTRVVFGDAYAKTAAGFVKILDASEVSLGENLTYAWQENTAWVGYIGGFGQKDSDNMVTQCGWLSNEDAGIWNVTVQSDYEKGYFNGVNYRQTTFDKNNQYQRLKTAPYSAGFAGSAIIAEYYDRGGEGCVFEPQIMKDTTGYVLSNVTAYFVDFNFNLVKTQKITWSVNPSAGFAGYIVFDISNITKAEYLALESHADEYISFGFHANWNGGKFVNADFGNISVAEGGLSVNTDFKALITAANGYYSFASDTAADGLTDFKFGGTNYGAVLNRTMKSYDYKSVDSVVYGRADGLNFRISNPEDQTYHYLYVKGNTSDLTDTEYFSFRVADHAFNAGKFEFFFYDAAKTFITRSGVQQSKEVYLFKKDGTFYKTIYPLNEWSWLECPAGFDGYMVIPLGSVDWKLDKGKAVYATIISQGSQGISNEQQGTLDTPTSDGFNIEFGRMQLIKEKLNEEKSNFSAILAQSVLYADLLNADRSGYSANVSGGVEMFTPVVSSALDYTYMATEGIALDAKNGSGSATVTAAIPQNAEKLAFYVYNEAIAELEIEAFFDNGKKPTEAKLVSVIDEVYDITVSEGKLKLPEGFEGYLIIDYPGGKPVISLDEGERLGIKEVFALSAGVSIKNASDVFKQSLTVLRTVTASDAVLTASIEADGIQLKRAVASYYLTPDAPTNFEDDSVTATVVLADDDDNYIYSVQDTYPIYKSPELYEGTPTIDLAKAPALIKGNVKYILFDEGETVRATVEKAGTVYVFAGKDFAAEGFSKKMAMESFINGVEGRIFLYAKTFESGDALEVTGAYLIIVDGAESEPIHRTVGAKFKFFEDIPNEYLLTNYKFFGCPAVEVMPSGRIYAAAITGGRTEPVIDNVSITYYSDDNGASFHPYMLVDHPYETMGRVLDQQLWYQDGKLWTFFAQTNKTFGNLRVFATYSENPDAEDIRDVKWSKPFPLIDGLMNSKPVKLSDGSYIYNSNQPEKNPGVVHVYKSTDGGMTAQKISEAPCNPAATMVFTEGKIVELPNGVLWLLKRVDGTTEDRTEQSFSTDGGKTWTVGTYNDELLCGSSRFVFTKLPSGNLLYVGDAGRERNRSDMTARLSTDNGKTWQYSLLLDGRTWVSYPDFAYLPDGKIMVMYDKGRTTHMEFRYAIITEADIMAGKIVTDGCSLMNIAFKNPKYKEITKVFALPETVYDAETGTNVVSFPTGTTRREIISAFPAEGISVGLNSGDMRQLKGSWTLGSIGANGYGTVTFMPEGGLSWDLDDSYNLLKVAVKIEKEADDTPTVTGIEISSEPTKKVYTLGEALDVEGLVVIEKYSDGTFKTLNNNEYTVSDVNTMTAGVKTVTVTKGEYSATFTVTVQSGGDNGGTENNSGNNGGTGENNTQKKGCGGSVAGTAFATLLLFAAAAVLAKKNKEKR